MAEIIQIKQDGVDQYPITKPECVIDENGKTIQQMMAKWGVVSQTQTWTQASDGGYDYVMSDLVRGWIPQANIDLFVSAGAVFNEESGYFELNGLTDISYEEMREIHSRSYMFKGRLNFDAYDIGTARTLYPIENATQYLSTQINLSWMANFCKKPLEVLVVNVAKQSLLKLTAFGYGGRLIKIQANPAISADRWESTTCQYSNYFQYVELTGLARNISFSSNPAFSTDSILYMINNEEATSAITITLHATAYERAMANEDIQTALEIHTNITLAEA